MGKKRKRLEATVALIQQRWGRSALRRGTGSAVEIPHIPTGFPALDKALAGIGGLPRGRITEILGVPTSGMATLALKIMVQAQAEQDPVAYVDLTATFDPDYAARCGLDLARLLLVRPATGREALEIGRALIAGRGVGVLVFDALSEPGAGPGGAQALSAALRPLPSALARSACAAIFLTPLQSGQAVPTADDPAGLALSPYAAVRLLLKKERWLKKGDDVRGYQAQVVVLKNKLGPAGRKARIAITFNGIVRGDST